VEDKNNVRRCSGYLQFGICFPVAKLQMCDVLKNQLHPVTGSVYTKMEVTNALL
jgi:hypothetical protein